MASDDAGRLAKLVKTHRAAGNKAFKEKNYPRAMYHYNESLKLKPDDINILLNRCSTLINLGDFVYAPIDAGAVIQLDPGNLKAKYYQALSIIGIRDYQSAVTYLNRVLPGVIPSERYNVLYGRMVVIRDRLTDQLNGIYDMEYFVKGANVGASTFPECAEYVGPITLVDIPGKGRGYVATETLKPGQLIMVSKALAVSEYSSVYVGDLTRSDMTVTSVECQVLKTLISNEALKREFFELYAGPEPAEYNPDDYGSVMLTASQAGPFADRLVQVCRYNMFSVVSGDLKMPGFGLWLKPSFFNHSCINTNTIDIIIKDFMFVRAVCEIKPGEEVLVNYVSPSIPYNRRKLYLSIKEFECTCDLCEYEKLEIPNMHVRREMKMEIADLFPSNTSLTPAQQKSLIRIMVYMSKHRQDYEWNFPLMLIERKLVQHFETAQLYHLCFWILKRHMFWTFGISNDFSYESFLKTVFMLRKTDCLTHIEEFAPMYTVYMNLFFGTDKIHWEFLKNLGV